MIQPKLYEWMHRPELLDRTTLYELRTLLDRYPFYQTARLLYLKNLYLLGDPAFKEELQRSSLYVADLGMLFYYIEGERFALQQHMTATAETEMPPSSSSDRTLDLIDRFLSDLPEQPSDTLPIPPVEASVDYASWLMKEEKTEEGETAADSAADESLLQGQQLIDRFIEQSADEAPVVPVEDVSEAEATVPPTPVSAEEPEEESYFTETLAKIYVKQQRYDKALEIIKKLNLKYPKKNAYFADQIRFLEKLIINAKSK